MKAQEKDLIDKFSGQFDEVKTYMDKEMKKV
jgi:hypothetical protein